ncbi:MAG: MarR family transcriptional regulator [Balneola sp.]|nr:MAG: MarR family transcriptional regulator [Balneola sp.]
MSKQYYSAIYQIITTGHWITDQVTKELKEFGISEPQFNVLRILKGAKGSPLTVETIQKGMVQKSSNITRLIDKLIIKGLVDRKECAENRRKMDITITEEGSSLLETLNKKVDELHHPMMDNLSPEELDSLSSLIIKLKSN